MKNFGNYLVICKRRAKEFELKMSVS